MIIWISKEASNRPNDQRAELIRVLKGRGVVVLFCADGEAMTVPLWGICGVEIGDGVTVKFEYKGWSNHERTRHKLHDRATGRKNRDAVGPVQ